MELKSRAIEGYIGCQLKYSNICIDFIILEDMNKWKHNNLDG